MVILRGIISALVIILIWQIIVVGFNLPSYILPSPLLVLTSLKTYGAVILHHAFPTMIEAGLGFILSVIFGVFWALMLIYFYPLRFWFLPLLLVSQALPVFAIAPLLVLWLGYGETSKIAITSIMLFFPITSAFYDGLRYTPQYYLDIAEIMNAKKWQTLFWIRVPNALPSFSNGLRLAASFAPMGAIIGEWVGANEGLGFLILNANSRMQIDLMFAAIIVLTILTLSFYYLTDLLMKYLTARMS